MRLLTIALSCSAVLGLLALSSGVLAGDGKIEINHAAAQAGIPAIGDTTPDYPITITQPGSYILTGDLTRPGDPNVNVIEISSDDVTLDLGGFAIRGTTECTVTYVGGIFASISCSPSAEGDGIRVGANHGIQIRNGTIVGMPSSGIDVHVNSRGLIVTSMIVRHCGDAGIRNAEGDVRDSHADHIGSTAIGASTIHRCSANDSYTGLSAGNITDSVASYCFHALTSGGVVATSRGDYSQAGLYCSKCVARNNRFRFNAFGMYFDGGGAYGGNMSTDSIMSDLVSAGGGAHETDPNVCGAVLCP